MDPAQPPVDAPPKSGRSSLGMALLVGVVVMGSLLGAVVYQSLQSDRKSAVDQSGFDLSQVSAPKPDAAPGASAGADQPQSGLSMITGVLPSIAFDGKPPQQQASGGQPAAQGQAQPGQDFAQLCRANETQVGNLARAYTNRYPSMRQYGRDWMGYPDLKKLNDDYMRNHDPIAFLRGLAKSDNFGKLIAKYATDPAIQGFAKDAIKRAPGDLVSAGMSFAKQDNLVGNLLDRVTTALGLPPGMFGGGADPSKINPNAVMSQMMNNNPDVQKALSSPDVQKQLDNNPQLQQQMNQNQALPAFPSH